MNTAVGAQTFVRRVWKVLNLNAIVSPDHGIANSCKGFPSNCVVTNYLDYLYLSGELIAERAAYRKTLHAINCAPTVVCVKVCLKVEYGMLNVLMRCIAQNWRRHGK